MSNRLLSTILLPPLLLLSIPLFLSAILTTSLTIFTLLIRVLLIYAEIALALLRTNLTPHPTSISSLPTKQLTPPHKPTTQPPSPTRLYPRRLSSGASSTLKAGDKRSGSTTPLAPSTSGLGIYSGSNPSRDFEGVGGWRVNDDDEEEDVLWTGMNSRLELPAEEKKGHWRHHQRSLTGGSAGFGYAGVARSPEKVRMEGGGRRGGGESPESYFVARGMSGSTTDLGGGGRGPLRPSSVRSLQMSQD